MSPPYTIWSSRCCFIRYRLFHVHLLCKIIRHTKAGSVWKQHSFFRTEMEKSEKTRACTMTSTWPGACWFDGGSWRRSRSSCWGWRWLAWTWWRTFPSGTSDRALMRGWSCWLSTIFARWWWRGVGQNDNSITCGGEAQMITILHKGGAVSWDHQKCSCNK